MSFKYEPPKTKTVIIQCTDYDNIPMNTHCYYAYRGFEKLGYKVILKPYTFFIDDENLAKEFIDTLPFEDLGCVFGQITFNDKILGFYNKRYPQGEDYPPELRVDNKFMRRMIIKEPIKQVLDRLEEQLKISKHLSQPIFIKPVKAKSFYGMSIKDKTEFNNFKIMSLRNPTLDIKKDECYSCESINIISEWRCYVLDGILMDCKHYKSDFSVSPDYNVIEDMIKTYKSAPVAYGLDVAVTEDGVTILIEVNRMDALGNYGLEETDYAIMIEAYWKECFL